MSPARKRHRRSADNVSSQPVSFEEMSAAQRMSAFRKEQAFQRTERAFFIDSLPFSPDPFQIEAMEALEEGEAVLVAAPTGAGKTIVGEFAMHLAIQRGLRAFYTTPIKALSNQKFSDLRERYGDDAVGLLTGDTSINSDAPIVVMTTEVLRNMIYAGAHLSDLGFVVLDEVHYLADRFRGPVWEEVIIHLPRHVQVVGLSATVSNAEEFGAWMREVRGNCQIIVSEKRPVPLYQHMIADGVLYDLYAPTANGQESPGRLNPELLSAVFQGRGSRSGGYVRGRGRGARHGRDEAASIQTRRFESRPAVAITLDRAGLLPAIVFVFSRAGVEEAVRSVMTAGIVFTSQQEAKEIRSELEDVCALIPVEDHTVLGISRWMAALERGIAGHHAGMLPVMKEAVERLFARGLVKLVYATETLALGINMPARTVVIESLQKWNGVAHVPLSAGEYTQLSGRAGRRGIDTEGHAVVLHKGKVAPEELSALASKRTYPLISAFHPTYNMVVNLLSYSTRAHTRDVLETSFAQFQADGSVVQLAQEARSVERQMAAYEPDLSCSLGDAREYFSLRDEASRAEKEAKKESVGARRGQAFQTLQAAKRGDVLSYRLRRRVQHAVVVDPLGANARFYAAHVIGTDGKWRQLTPQDVSSGVVISGHVAVNPVALKKAKERERLAQRVRQMYDDGLLNARVAPSTMDARISDLQRELRAHPVHRCPERDIHAQAGHQWARLHREYERLMGKIDRRTNSVAKAFDKVCAVCEDLGFIRGDEVTSDGQKLRRIFGERDIVVAQAARLGVFDDLLPAELAAVLSVFVFESRSDEVTQRIPSSPGQRIAHAWDEALLAQSQVHEAEKRAGRQPSPDLDAGLVAAIYSWAQGSSLSTAVEGEDMQAGDFVRWIRQVADLLDQLRFLEDEDLAERARVARGLIMRGVASWSGV